MMPLCKAVGADRTAHFICNGDKQINRLIRSGFAAAFDSRSPVSPVGAEGIGPSGRIRNGGGQLALEHGGGVGAGCTVLLKWLCLCGYNLDVPPRFLADAFVGLR